MSGMKTILLLMIFASLALMTEREAYAEYWEEPAVSQHWNFSLAPGYGLLYVNGESAERHGFGARLLAGYLFTPNWGLDMKTRMGVYGGDGAGQQGIYSHLSATLAARYTFDLDWVKPYFIFGLGYIYSRLDREAVRQFTSHSMLIEPGFGVSFRITPAFWLGLETTVAPFAFGNEQMNGSFFFHSLVSFELHL